MTGSSLPRLHAAVYDLNGREASDAEPILKALPNVAQYIFCSSAGVYLKSDEMPHREVDATDPKSRHKVGHALLPLAWGSPPRQNAQVAAKSGSRPGPVNVMLRGFSMHVRCRPQLSS